MDTKPITTMVDYSANINASPLYERDQRDILLWFNDHIKAEGCSLNRAGQLIGFSGTVIQRVLSGNYNADPGKIIGEIARYKTIADARSNMGGGCPYVQTAMATRVWDAANYALHRRQIVSIIGTTQRGKTTAIKEYAKAHGAMVVYVRCPVAPTPGRIARKVALQLGLRSARSLDSCMDYISRILTSQHLVVIDEIHQVILQERGTGIRVVEILREIADEAECGMLLIGTKVWCDALNRDVSWKGVLEQIVKRGMTVALKDQLPLSDLRMIWQQYGLPDPEGDALTAVKRVAAEHGLGRYTKLLAIGYTLASKAATPYGWEYFLRAIATVDALAEA